MIISYIRNLAFRKIQYGDVTLDSDTVRVHVLFIFAPVDVTKEVLDFCVLGEERNDFQKTSGLLCS